MCIWRSERLEKQMELTKARTIHHGNAINNSNVSAEPGISQCIEQSTIGWPAAPAADALLGFTASCNLRGSVAAHDVLQVFLAAGACYRRDVGRYGGIGDRGQRRAALEHGAGRFVAPTRVALIDE